MIHQVRVIFGDTDQLGIVYYANYLRWFESARGALLRERGLSGQQIFELGVAFPVAEAFCKYLRPARYEDLLDVDVRISELGHVRVRFVYEIRRDGVVLASGQTLHACVDVQSGAPVRIPDSLRAALESPG